VQSQKKKFLAKSAIAASSAPGDGKKRNSPKVSASSAGGKIKILKPVMPVQVDVSNCMRSLGTNICDVVGPVNRESGGVACPTSAARTSTTGGAAATATAAVEPDDSCQEKENEEGGERIPEDVVRKIMENIKRKADLYCTS